MQSINRRSLFALSLATGVVGVLYLSEIAIISTWNSLRLPSQDLPNLQVKIDVASYTSPLGFTGGDEGRMSAQLLVEVPQTIRTSESKLVHAKFIQETIVTKPVSSLFAWFTDPGNSYTFALAAPEVLEVAPKEKQIRRVQSSPPIEINFSLNLYSSADCDWTVRPREPGEFTVLLTGIWQSPEGKPIPSLELQSKQFTIRALTPIGLSAKAANYLQFASILIALIGGALAFPFLKSRFEPRKRPEPTAQKEESKIIITDDE